MAYTVLARRYRSQSFDDLVGQQPIAQTLHNAIATGRVHHAYLFCGTRGVGKTSMARLFARVLNAPDTIEGAPKPENDTDFPPLDVQQRMADAIMRGDDMNVIEIDGASNRGVDDARDLIANAGLSPTDAARYKVYIIDEVHMLTREAFNALLKTMEEPPEHLKFVLCTTEAHKVPATIQSRCQRFDFRNIATRAIAEHLRRVVDGEAVAADDALLYAVARLGQGSMRDALSLLDRLLATGEDPLTTTLLEKMVGLPDRQHLTDLVDAIAEADPAATLKAADAMVATGIAQDQLLDALIEHLRDLMLIAACGPDSDLVELDEQSRAQAAQQAARFDTPVLVHMIALCENVQRNSKLSSTPRALLDAALVRLALSEQFADLAGLLAGAGAEPSKKKVAIASPLPQPRQTSAAAAPPNPPDPAQPPPSQPPPASPAAQSAPPAPRRRLTQEDIKQALDVPLVRELSELFDASVEDLKEAPTSAPADRQDPDPAQE
ncbi:MAG: DNA polymerase III, subunit gamma and tau [Planctomycetaceae bacterium]|nr:DNA polymerase III, subunit gamma and tau [Planctomycetaceae bacterium]